MNDSIKTILNRHSIRYFSDRQILKPYLEMIVRSGVQAPNSHNLQTWRFIVLHYSDKTKMLHSLLAESTKENAAGFYGFENSKAVLLVCNDRRNANAIQDASCADGCVCGNRI